MILMGFDITQVLGYLTLYSPVATRREKTGEKVIAIK